MSMPRSSNSDRIKSGIVARPSLTDSARFCTSFHVSHIWSSSNPRLSPRTVNTIAWRANVRSTAALSFARSMSACVAGFRLGLTFWLFLLIRDTSPQAAEPLYPVPLSSRQDGSQSTVSYRNDTARYVPDRSCQERHDYFLPLWLPPFMTAYTASAMISARTVAITPATNGLIYIVSLLSVSPNDGLVCPVFIVLFLDSFL